MGDDHKPLDKPHNTIGVQDLLSLHATRHCGFLRKKGRLERFAERVKIVKPLMPSVAKWRQKFVVLSRGCIYIYLDEFARCPSQAYSLNGYYRIIRHNPTDGRERWSFQIDPDDELIDKQLIFGCATEDDRKKWMNAVRNQILLANNVLEPDTMEDKDDYINLEKNVKDPRPKQSIVKIPPKKSKEPPPPIPGDSEDDEGDDDDDDEEEENSDYDRISEEGVNEILSQRKKEQPPAPSKKAEKQEQGRKKPAKSPKPVLVKQISRQDFEFQGTNRQQVDGVLNPKPVGTFLVRKSRSDDREVLSVKTEEGIKEYKIYNNEGKGYSIDNQKHFDSVEKLIEHYMSNPLPNRTMSLYRAFSTVE